MPSKELLAARLVQQRALFRTLESVEKFVKDFNADRDLCQIPVRLETLDRVNTSFLQVQDDVETSDDATVLEKHLTERVAFEQRYCVAKGFLLAQSTVDMNQTQNTSMLSQHNSTTFHLRLPKIDLPKFNGDFSRWLSFRDTFMSMVHSNGGIPTVAKLQYLLQSLEGEAKKPFESVDVEADNYATTWEALQKRYNNRRFLKRQLFRALYDLPQVKQECAKRIHCLVDDFQRHVRALERLGEPVDHWDTPLTNILSYKLDHSTLRAWEEKSIEKEDVTYAELVEFLHQRVRILNSVGPESQKTAIVKVAGNPHKNFHSKVSSNAAATSSSKSACPLSCSESHTLRECPAFLAKDIRQRRELVSQHRLCWNCLGYGHQSKKCGSKYKCRTCHERHHSLLHDPAFKQVSSNPDISSSFAAPAAPMYRQPFPSTLHPVDNPQPLQVSMAAQTACTTVLLETVLLNVIDDHGKVHEARALLDSGSMSNFISGQLAKNLYSLRSKVDISVAGIGLSTQRIRSAITTTIQSKNHNFSTKLQFLVLRQPSAELPTVPIDTSAWDLSNVILADPQFHTPAKIDLVIGSEAFWEVHTGHKVSLGKDLPWISETPFGWVVSGSAPNATHCIPQICNLSAADERLEASLRKFWEMETIPSDLVQFTDENRCEELYAATTTRDTTGRYIVRLPRVENAEVVLGESKSIADRRFLSLERRLERDPITKDSYHQFMDEYLQLGHMKKVRDPVNDIVQHCYIPHHVVFKESSTTTKVRVVFDASCKTSSGYSLNDTLLVGPVVQQDLYLIYLRFRTRKVAIVADVEKMYRQVLHHHLDVAFLRIRYRRNSTDPISTYELQTVTYGTASAPYLATRTLLQIAKDHKHLYPAAVESVVEDFYVDDLLSGASDVESAIVLRREITAMLNSAGFTLKKWASNAQDALEEVPPEDLAIQPLHNVQDEQTISTLGLLWDPSADMLRFRVQLPLAAAVLTKRKVMSYIAQIFDPLGLVGPIITKAKIFMQRLWALKRDGEPCEWDTPLPEKLQHEWKQFHSTLHIIGEIRIPRFVLTPGVRTIQLHFFADASQLAYGACCFVRTESKDGVTVCLLTSKSKVAPLSTHHSIARLELCAARLATQLYKKIEGSLKISATSYFWTDSTTVLYWLRASPNRWKTFVANRVSQIQTTTDIGQWKHVAGTDNPADDISRGLDPTDILNCQRWWIGPPWLSLDPEQWPVSEIDSQYSPAASEEGRKIPLIAMTATQSSFTEDLFARFSSFAKLRRSVALCVRYINRLKERIQQCRVPEIYKPLIVQPNKSYTENLLTTEELQYTELLLCRLAQRQMFAEELADISKGDRVDKSSRLKYLHPFVGRDGTLRVGGRLRNAAVADAIKHPIVLSSKHPLSALLASHYHCKLLHAGPSLLLATLRQKYWILGGRNLAKSIYHQCHTCFKSKPTLVQQSTADLPVSRVSPTRPFAVCGVDYCGPFFVKSEVRKRGPTKVYVAIFVCFATRAVHIELVSDLSTPAFLAALRRLVSHRGMIAEIHSDNATTFKGASHALNRLYRMLKVEEADRQQIFNWCAENEIRWKFIPPRAPHFGGLWEAAVKSAKTHMRKTIGNSSLRYEDMLTLLAQVEMCLNSRPLTPLPDSSSDLEVLTPGHFLVGSSLQAVPDRNLKNIPDNRLDHWDFTQKNLQTIWSRWYPEYLQQLQARAKKGCNPPVTVKEGAIVIIKEDNVPPTCWPLGRITKLHTGKDGIVRVVTLKTAAAKEMVRPVARIALLPSPSTTSS